MEGLRHAVQHLDRKIPTLVDQTVPVWGTVEWLVLLDQSRGLIRACTLVPGTLFNATHPFQNPRGREFRATVDHVTLKAAGIEANLSDIMSQVARLASAFEEQLRAQFVDQPKYGADMVVCVDVEALPDDPTVASPEAAV